MDAISLVAAGVSNVAASLGTAFTAEQCRLLLRYAKEICFCYDSDEAGQRATIRALSVVRRTDAKARVLIVPDGKDPDEYVRKHGGEAFHALAENALSIEEFHFRYALRTNDTRTLDGKNRALRAFLPVLKAAGPVEQNEYIGKLQRNLGIDEGIIRQEMSAYQGDDPAEEFRPRMQRPVMRKADDAVQRAGRVLIRMAWRDPGVAASVIADLEESPYPYPPHEELLRYIARCAGEHRSPSDEEVLDALGEETAAELSRILTEEIVVQEEKYDEYLQVILLAQLRSAFEEHRLRADEMERKGNSDFLQELQKSQRIKKRIDELHQDLNTNG